MRSWLVLVFHLHCLSFLIFGVLIFKTLQCRGCYCMCLIPLLMLLSQLLFKKIIGFCGYSQWPLWKSIYVSDAICVIEVLLSFIFGPRKHVNLILCITWYALIPLLLGYHMVLTYATYLILRCLRSFNSHSTTTSWPMLCFFVSVNWESYCYLVPKKDIFFPCDS